MSDETGVTRKAGIGFGRGALPGSLPWPSQVPCLIVERAADLRVIRFARPAGRGGRADEAGGGKERVR